MCLLIGLDWRIKKGIKYIFFSKGKRHSKTDCNDKHYFPAGGNVAQI